MSTFIWITLGGIAMTLVALVGGLVVLLEPSRFQRVLRPLVALSAGSLLGGAFFHMLPAALDSGAEPIVVMGWAMLGFTSFFALEQFLHWHHCHRAAAQCRQPMATLVLLGDGLHNLLGGLAVGGTFLIDIRLGITTWLAAAAHEIPQELGDFGVLVHAGYLPKQAFVLNALSALTFLVGGWAAYWVSGAIDVGFLVPLAAGNFIYIGASDLVPEVNKHERIGASVLHFAAFSCGVLALLATRLLLE